MSSVQKNKQYFFVHKQSLSLTLIISSPFYGEEGDKKIVWIERKVMNDKIKDTLGNT